MKYKTGLVSVIIPCYNSSDYMQVTLDSLFNQTYSNFEVIVIDDGSNQQQYDKLLAILTSFNLKLNHRNDTNKGACNARNTGEKFSSGEYLFFCDSDIRLHPDIFQKMTNVLKIFLNHSWCYCNFTVGAEIRKFEAFSLENIKRANCSSTMSMLRHVDFHGFDESLKRLQDWDLFYRLAKSGKQGIFLNEFLFAAADRPGISKNGISFNEAITELRKKHPEIGY